MVPTIPVIAGFAAEMIHPCTDEECGSNRGQFLDKKSERIPHGLPTVDNNVSRYHNREV